VNECHTGGNHFQVACDALRGAEGRALYAAGGNAEGADQAQLVTGTTLALAIGSFTAV
jgi:hypothetical protein